jgi:hypothetical protein
MKTQVGILDRAAGAVAPAVDVAAKRLYEAEVALHCARQSHVDAWIAAAADRLHDAIEAYLRVIAERRAA